MKSYSLYLNRHFKSVYGEVQKKEISDNPSLSEHVGEACVISDHLKIYYGFTNWS